MKTSVLLDTSFLIRLLNDNDPLHLNAKGFYKYFLQKEIGLKVSTISIAEYCVRGKIEELPLRDVRIIPFNFDHALKTGEIASVIFNERDIDDIELTPRAIIPNDSKLFAQADLDKEITHFVRSNTTFKFIKNKLNPKFDLINISKPYNEVFGVLDL